MAPNKTASRPLTVNNIGNVATRSRATTLQIKNINLNKGIDKIDKMIRGKRKADFSPTKDKAVKRTALGDVTNNSAATKVVEGKVKVIV